MNKARNCYQLHIQLCDTKPAVWRRLVVADSMSLADLHRAIQAIMGWQNRHPYLFEIAGQRYGLPDADNPEDTTMHARRYTLGQLLQGRPLTIRYLYDKGGVWMHRIKLESVLPVSNAVALSTLPMCLAGRNACPPENCGGPSGFAQFIEAIRDAAHPQHPAARALHSGDYDTKHFDLQRAQARLRSWALLHPHTALAGKPEPVLA